MGPPGSAAGPPGSATGRSASGTGTPAERTGLAWRRTALAAAGFAAVAFKSATNNGGVIDGLSAGVAMLAAVTVYLCGRLRELRPTQPISGGVMTVAVIASFAATAVAAVAVAVAR
jgi:uncharacterized membrane protein YidH (DUF202 family)